MKVQYNSISFDLELTTEHVLRTGANRRRVLRITFYFLLCLLLPVRALLCGFLSSKLHFYGFVGEIEHHNRPGEAPVTRVIIL